MKKNKFPHVVVIYICNAKVAAIMSPQLSMCSSLKIAAVSGPELIPIQYYIVQRTKTLERCCLPMCRPTPEKMGISMNSCNTNTTVEIKMRDKCNERQNMHETHFWGGKRVAKKRRLD